MRNLNLIDEHLYTQKNTNQKQELNCVLQNAQLSFLNGLSCEEEINNEVFDLYRKYIENLCTFIRNTNIGDNDLERAMFFQYLFINGYLTSTNKQKKPFFEYNIGLNALLCSPNAVNIAKLYYDTFRRYYQIVKSDCGTLYPLEYPCFKSNKSNNRLAKKNSINYAVNIVFFDNALYGYDLITNELYQCNGPFEMSLMKNESREFLRYKPFFDFISKPNEINFLSDIQHYLDQFNNSSILYTSFNYNEFKEIYHSITDKIQNITPTLKEFQKEANGMVSLMHEKVLSKKR